MAGISLVSWWHGEMGSPAGLAAMEEIADLGAGWIAVVPTGYQKDARDLRGPRDDPRRTATREDLRAAIAAAHARGLKVMLKPHVDLEDGAWRAGIGLGFRPAEWKRWFAAYRAWLLPYARLAAELDVEALCIGTELAAATLNPAPWRRLIAELRGTYPGILTYAADWSGEADLVLFWDRLDWVGVDWYHPISEKAELPPLDELVEAWEPLARRLEALARRAGKPLVFTEIGYRSAPGTWRAPADWQASGEPDPLAQARLYLAAARALRGRPWFKGFFVWAWDIGGDKGGPKDTGYTPRGKPAAEVLQLVNRATKFR